MRSRPDLAPGAAGDEVLPLGVKRIPVGIGAVDPAIAQNLAAGVGATAVTLLVVHRFAPLLITDPSRAKIPAPHWCKPPPARHWKYSPPPATPAARPGSR